MSKFKPEHEAVLNGILKNHPAAKPGKMFGFPGYKVNGKLAAGLFSNGIILKLGTERAGALIGKVGIETFEPLPGRPWKDWVLVTDKFEDHRALFDEAVQYVLTETGG